MCEECGVPVAPGQLSSHRYTTHVDRVKLLVVRPNLPDRLYIYDRWPDGLFQCTICLHRMRDARTMTVSFRQACARLMSDVGL